MALADHAHSTSLEDDELLRNTGQGCSDCFAVLFHRYCRQVFSVAFRILRDKAETEDILQEVFLSILLQQERYDPARGSVRTWILQFAYFKALLRRRYLNVRNYYKQEEVREGRESRIAESPKVLGISVPEWARFVEAGIASLTAKQRQVINMVHFEGYTLQESSEILRDTLASTRNNYYRGLRALRDFLSAQTARQESHDALVLERKDVPV